MNNKNVLSKTYLKEMSDITSVVKVAYIRPTYDNWMEDPDHIYIGRKGIVFVNKERYPKKDSIWANIFKIDKNTNRDQVIQLYESYIREKIEKEGLQQELLKLEGKKLGCWCYPEKCHGGVLLRLISEYKF